MAGLNTRSGALAHLDQGSGEPVLMIHGWPGDHTDYEDTSRIVSQSMRVIVPDLGGVGESFDHGDYEYPRTAEGHGEALLKLMSQIDIKRPFVVAGYDIGSSIAQFIARRYPERVSRLILAPPLPGAGARVLGRGAQEQLWYQHFHKSPVAEEILDSNPEGVEKYIRYWWERWSSPRFSVGEERISHLAGMYSRPGAFAESICWYKNGQGLVETNLDNLESIKRISVPTTILWPEEDPLHPVDWMDTLGNYFEFYRVHKLKGIGHFVPVEASELWARTVLDKSILGSFMK